MRRVLGVIAAWALIAVLGSGIAHASAEASLTAPPLSLATELFRRCFSEPLAPRFDAGSELALVVSIDAPAAGTAPLPLPSLRLRDLAANLYEPSAPSLATPDSAGVSVAPVAEPSVSAIGFTAPVSSPEPALGSYQEIRTSLPADLPRTLSFSPVLNPAAGFTAGSIGADSTAAGPATGAAIAVPGRVGHVHFTTHADAAQAQSAPLSLKDTALGGGATFDTRIGRVRAGVDVSSRYEHLTLDAPQFTATSFDGASSYAAGPNNLPVFVPAYADVSKHTLSAGVAVPVSPHLTAAVGVDQQHLLGGYGAPGIANLDANNTIYGARLTYQFKGPTALSLSARQFRYQDNLIQSNAFVQTSAALNFSIKF